MADRDEDEEGQRRWRQGRYSTGLRYGVKNCDSLVPEPTRIERVLQRWTVDTRMKYGNPKQGITRYW